MQDVLPRSAEDAPCEQHSLSQAQAAHPTDAGWITGCQAQTKAVFIQGNFHPSAAVSTIVPHSHLIPLVGRCWPLEMWRVEFCILDCTQGHTEFDAVKVGHAQQYNYQPSITKFCCLRTVPRGKFEDRRGGYTVKRHMEDRCALLVLQ